jgi:hypothetical protein
LLAVALLAVGSVVSTSYCPAAGIAVSAETRAIHELKNRTAFPKQWDFDTNISLSSMLEPGDDSTRYSAIRAAQIQGYVVDVSEGGIELANCYSPWRRDTHIGLALRPDAPPREQVVMEISATIRDWAQGQGRDWSTATLKSELLGHWCYFEGWMFFDSAHAHESENTAPGRSGNWRATAWELHPVTYLEVKKVGSELRALFPSPPKAPPRSPSAQIGTGER